MNHNNEYIPTPNESVENAFTQEEKELLRQCINNSIGETNDEKIISKLEALIAKLT